MRRVWLALMFCLVITLTGCLDHYSWRQKMTITVEADGKTYSGSSVTQVNFRRNDPISSVNGPEWVASFRGEAPFVEIPGRGVLFALLNPPDKYTYTEDLALKAFSGFPRSEHFEDRLKRLRSDLSKSVTLPASLYPYFVLFTDVSNPRSIRDLDVNEASISSFDDIRLMNVTLEITKEPVTEDQVSSVLTWLNDPSVMENPGWSELPVSARKVIGRLLSHYPRL